MEKKPIIILLAILFVNWHWFEPVARKNSDGIKAYEEKLFNKALKKFLSAKGLNPESSELKNNTASALYNLNKYQEALEEFSKINPEKAGIDNSKFFYNLGNTFFRLNKYKEALKNYKKSLMSDPDDVNTKKNFELTLKKIKNKNKKKDDKEKKKDKKRQDKNKKYKNIMNYLSQKDKDQMKKVKRKASNSRKTKDW